MKYISYGCFALGALGVWIIFHGEPVYGSITYLVGTVVGVVLTSYVDYGLSPPHVDEVVASKQGVV
jgi:hypothetical protein